MLCFEECLERKIIPGKKALNHDSVWGEHVLTNHDLKWNYWGRNRTPWLFGIDTRYIVNSGMKNIVLFQVTVS